MVRHFCFITWRKTTIGGDTAAENNSVNIVSGGGRQCFFDKDLNNGLLKGGAYVGGGESVFLHKRVALI